MVGGTKTEAILVLFVNAILSQHLVSPLGKRTFGESCSFGGRITSFFSNEREDTTCNTEMGLICTGSCSCPPGRVWDFNANDYGFADRSSRGCAGAVGSPCFGTSRNQQCVSNAYCQYAFCRCKTNFRPNGGHCVSVGAGPEPETNSDDNNDESPAQTRPASGGGISFPELQEIFAGFNSQQNSHNLNDFNNNGNGFNDRFIGDSVNNFNDRFATSENYYNDRFQVNPDDSRSDHYNSRDGSKSSSVRFEE